MIDSANLHIIILHVCSFRGLNMCLDSEMSSFLSRIYYQDPGKDRK